MDPPNGQPFVKWDANPDEPLYYHDPDSDVAFQTDDEELWQSPQLDLQGPKVD